MSSELSRIARRADTTVAVARADLVRAVRAAAREGMTQQQIAREIGRSQPEVSRLLHFHGRTELAQRVRRNAPGIRTLIGRAGGRDVRVFGSVADGTDGEHSDVDLLFTPGRDLSLFELGTLERRLAELIGAPVDLVTDANLRPDLRQRVLSSAVPL